MCVRLRARWCVFGVAAHTWLCWRTPGGPHPAFCAGGAGAMATWNCQACTLENQDAVSTCTACRSPHPVSMGEWVCPTCTHRNSRAIGRCGMCVTAHPVAPHCPILTNSGSILLLLHSSQIPKKKAGTAQAFRAPRPRCSGLQTHAHHCRCTCCVEGVQSCRAARTHTGKGTWPSSPLKPFGDSLLHRPSPGQACCAN